MGLVKSDLEKLYINDGKSVREISQELNISRDSVRLLMTKFSIPTRSISEAIYLRSNPNGDPFSIKSELSEDEKLLFGLGIGLYWGEGNKADPYSVRLGNTDPDLILLFIKFLKDICGLNEDKLRYGLQTFNDVDPDQALG